MDFSGISIILIICFILILFFSLIFNEIIEINFWGLSDNTKKNIAKRAELDNSNLEEKLTMNSIVVNDGYRVSLIELEQKNSVRDSL